MKTIVRIEHSDGTGMFTKRDETKKLARHININFVERFSEFNIPLEDGLDISYDHYCAFKSINHLREWVYPDEIEVFLKNNYRVYLIEVSQVLEGKHNTLYKKEDIISKTDISDRVICHQYSLF